MRIISTFFGYVMIQTDTIPAHDKSNTSRRPFTWRAIKCQWSKKHCFFFDKFNDNVTSTVYKYTSEVWGAEQHWIADMKCWAPNDIADGKKLIRNRPGRCKTKEHFEREQEPKDFSLKKMRTVLAIIWCQWQWKCVGEGGVSSLLSFWVGTPRISFHIYALVHSCIHRVLDHLTSSRYTKKPK